MTRFLALVAVAFVAAGAFAFYNSQSSAPSVSLLPSPANVQSAADVDISGVVEMTLGAEDAPVTVLEYASFTCPYCANFHKGPFKSLKSNYIDSGKVKFVYREVYFDRFGLWAGMIARCGGQERYFGITDLIYEQQGEWTRGEPAQVIENLRRIGRTAGLTNEELDVCMSDGKKAEALVAYYEMNATADEIRSTPSFIVNGTQHGNMNYSAFSALIDEEIGG